MSIEKDILAFFARKDARPMRRRALARAVGHAGDDYPLFRAALRELEAHGRVACVKGRRYALAERVKVKERGARRQARRALPRLAGTLDVKAAGFAFLRPEEAGEADVYIPARDLGGAMDGDRVAVELLYERAEREPRRGKKPRRGRSDAARAGSPPRRRGRVVEVIERVRTHVVGTFRKQRAGAHVVPDDPALGELVRVAKGGVGGAHAGEKVVVRFTRYPSRAESAVGEIAEVLGRAGDLEVETTSIVREFGLREEFPGEALAEARAFAPGIPELERGRRADYTAQPACTIDPLDASDFDDAIYVEKVAKGWRAHVHIADVGHYVAEGSALDREAVARGNSAYLPGRWIPMLPEALSSGLCSLRPGEERLARTVVIDFDASGRRRRYRLERSVIRSAVRLAYREVPSILAADAAAPDVPPGVAESLRAAKALAGVLRARRLAAGSLELDVPEVRVLVDARGETVGLEKRAHDASHSMVEELMLAANRCVAEELARREVPGIYRVHEEPDEEGLRAFARAAEGFGVPLKPPYTRARIGEAVDRARELPGFEALQFALLTSLKQARYSARAEPHYALAFHPYCHFTSPIRRYPDLVVHRALSALYATGRPAAPARPKERRLPMDDREAREARCAHLAAHTSVTERRAEEAERACVRLRQIDWLRTRRERVHRGRITGVKKFGLFVELEGVWLDGLLPFANLDDDRYVAARNGLEAVGRHTRRRLRVGERLDVRIVRLDLSARAVELAPVS